MNVFVWVAMGLFGKWVVEKTLAAPKPTRIPAEVPERVATPRPTNRSRRSLA